MFNKRKLVLFLKYNYNSIKSCLMIKKNCPNMTETERAKNRIALHYIEIESRHKLSGVT